MLTVENNSASQLEFPNVASKAIVSPKVEKLKEEAWAQRLPQPVVAEYLPEKFGEEPSVNFEFYRLNELIFCIFNSA